jgi:hypothetical protein
MSIMDRGVGLGAGQAFGTAGRILLTGALLAALLFVAFRVLDNRGSPMDLGQPLPIEGPPQVRVAVPELDPEILTLVRDGTREQRLVLDATEEKALKHLLAKSANIGPEAARALGRPNDPIEVARLRVDPGSERGRYLMYRGTLIHVSPPRAGHPLDGFDIHEGAIRTPDDEVVFFAVSRPLPDDIGEGSYVEVEGFFFGLRDSNVIVDAREAPVLVGPRVRRAMRPWPEVTELDPAILDAEPDGEFDAEAPDGQQWLGLEEMRRPLQRGQTESLWHLASYARHEAERTDLDTWREIPAFVTKEQLDETRLGTMPRGTPVRVLGEFVFARWMPAETNPIGVDAWSEVWIQVPDLGGKLLPVWVPERIEGFERRDPIEARAYYFRRRSYETAENEVFAPLFVAAHLDRYTRVEHVGLQIAGWTFFVLVAITIVFVFWMSFGDRKRQRQTEEALAARRRRRLAARIADPDAHAAGPA